MLGRFELVHHVSSQLDSTTLSLLFCFCGVRAHGCVRAHTRGSAVAWAGEGAARSLPPESVTAAAFFFFCMMSSIPGAQSTLISISLASW